MPIGEQLLAAADGKATAASFVGRWRSLSADRFVVDWPTYTDQLVLPEVGGSFTGINNYGMPQQVSRVGRASADRRNLTGSWRYNRIPAVASQDRAFVAGPFRGRWRATVDGSFVVEWTHRWTSTVSLLSDENQLKGGDILGIQTSAVRSECQP